MAISFDGPNRLISLSTGTITLSVIDLWSRWVDWLKISDNSKYLPAFRQVGADPIDLSAGTSIPTYIFMLNGWRVRPQEDHHTLNVFEGILVVEGGGDPFINTIGNYNIRINYSQPVQAITATFISSGDGVLISDQKALLDAAVTAATTASTKAAQAVTLLTDMPTIQDANVVKVNGITINGTGADNNPWGPA